MIRFLRPLLTWFGMVGAAGVVPVLRGEGTEGEGHRAVVGQLVPAGTLVPAHGTRGRPGGPHEEVGIFLRIALGALPPVDRADGRRGGSHRKAWSGVRR